MPVIHIKDEAELNELISKDTLTVVDFFATWCGPCVQISPFLEELSSKYPDVVFVKVDVDELEAVAASHDVSAMPTFKFFKSGTLVETIVGANKTKLEETVVNKK